MSNIKKTQRKEDQQKWYQDGLELIKDLICYISADLAIKDLRRNVLSFAKKNEMTDYDVGEFERLCYKYNIGIVNGLDFKIIERFGERLFDKCLEILDQLVAANSTYPGTNYQYNLKLQNIQNVISGCEYIYTSLQLVMEMCTLKKDIDRLMMFLSRLFEFEEHVKNWKKKHKKEWNKAALNGQAIYDANQKLLTDKALLQMIEDAESKANISEKKAREYKLCCESYKEVIDTANREICEIAYSRDPKWFGKQYYTENGARRDPAIVFFPKNMKILPTYVDDYLYEIVENPFQNLIVDN